MPRRSRKNRTKPADIDPNSHTAGWKDPRRLTGLLLFVVALAMRILFWQATPDADWPHSAYYKGDAPTWVEYARSIHAGTDFELGLPLRPPGAGYLLAAVWDGSGPPTSAQIAWCLLGALTVLLIYATILRTFGLIVAGLLGLYCAVSYGLMVLSTSLNNETPYLFLVVLTFWFWPRLDERRSVWWLWGAVHGLACLVRVEHLLVFAICWLWRAGARRAGTRHFAGPLQAGLAFVLVLLPWHLDAWHSLHRFNTLTPEQRSEDLSRTEQAQIQLEQALAEIRWTDEAAAARQEFPAFARRAAANFVAATVAFRSPPGSPPTVDLNDLELLDLAFGTRPEPLPSRPFVTFYGGLNFYLAHNPRAEVGFSRALLDQPPPLDGGPYPAMLVSGLPPRDLSFTYPPHLRAVNEGYRLGLRYIVDHPGTTLRRAFDRALAFWSGVSLGVGGYDVPLGLEATRRRADLAVPNVTPFLGIWRAFWFVAGGAGLWLAWRQGPAVRSALVPWLALGGTKLLVSVVFFGYARHGATAIPVFVLLAALALVPSGLRTPDCLSRVAARRLMLWTLCLTLAFVALEAGRWWRSPELLLDDRAVGASDPWPMDEHEDRVLRSGP